jgi:hypothetical protein
MLWRLREMRRLVEQVAGKTRNNVLRQPRGLHAPRNPPNGHLEEAVEVDSRCRLPIEPAIQTRETSVEIP